jgi:predicted DsbA family dithiol-disulfide isomerase
MELTMLAVPGCPNAAALEERLAVVLADYPDAVVRRRQVADEQEAAETGMAGSPTLLVNGTDPFAVPGQAPGLSCRLYRDEAGRLAGAPSVEDLRRALEQADVDGQPAP